MFNELCIPVTMKVMALGHSLYVAQYLAAVAVLQMVLLWILLGYRVVLPDEEGWLEYHTVSLWARGISSLGIQVFIPVFIGIAGINTRALLQE